MALTKQVLRFNELNEDPLSRFVKNYSFELHCFGHQHNDIHATCDYRLISDFELIFVLGGQSIITIGKSEHRLTKGDIILIPPFTLHKIQTPADDPHDNYFIHFDVFPFYRQTEFFDILSRAIAAPCTEPVFSTLVSLYRQMEEVMEQKRSGYGFYMETLFSQLFINLIRNDCDWTEISGRDPKYSLAETEIVDRSMQFIRNNVEKSITIKDICGHLHISESYLYKAFSKVAALSPNYLIQLYKLKHAEQLLKTTSYSIKEISQLLCFSSPYYFSTVFKQAYGTSPLHYRNSYSDFDSM